MKIDRYALYERAVQSPEHHAAWFRQVYREIRGREPESLREDFCGTFRISSEWIKAGGGRQALALDLDPEPLGYGRQRIRRELSAGQRRRLKVLQKDVISISRPGVDVVAACNFSFYIFQRRQQLVEYFRCCRASLRAEGLAIFEMAGGPGMIARSREQKSYARGKTPAFTYIWDQKAFNPITHQARYSIHFRFPNGERIQDAFSYDWRLWTIPEVRDALLEAGFADSWTYWELEHRGKGTGEFVRTEEGDNAYAWLAYVVAGK